MIRFSYVLILLMLSLDVFSNHVRIEDLKWDNTSVSTSNPVLKMTFNVSWDNSWRDDFNYDAVYVFFKFKVKDAENAPGVEKWHHLYLQDEGNKLGYGTAQVDGYSFWLSPLSAAGIDYNTGIYIYRNKNGYGNSSVDVTVSWNIVKQIGKSLIASQIENNEILISAQAIEMVYVPQGAFRIGDGVSAATFGKKIVPVLPEYDEVKATYDIRSTGKNGIRAANHVNENLSDTANAWVGVAGTANYWRIDFGEGNEKKIRYVGINASKYFPNNYPVTFRVEAFNKETDSPTVLWEGDGKSNWVMAQDAYPAERAILLDTTKIKKFRFYRIYIDRMNAGYPVVNTIAMTEANLDHLVDKTVVIDGAVIAKDTLRGLGAFDQEVWTGSIPKTFPTGYKPFFAMKYPITQEQYVRFLNKLDYAQQNQLLGGQLGGIPVGDYIFGENGSLSFRNGIIVAAKPEGLPVVFANNLDGSDPASREADGQMIACNYMSVSDMLAYADWACLRPLTEMEFEKMSRRPFPAMPLKGEFAWNTLRAIAPGVLGMTAGKNTEKPETGNANFGREPSFEGPIRVGAFATANTTREQSGAGFSGVMDLSGNVAEIYYNTKLIGGALGMRLLWPETYSGGIHHTAHGDGYLSATGAYDGYRGNSMQWSVNPLYFGVRGGSWASDSIFLAVSDRSYAYNYFTLITHRDSTTSFRLGRSLPEEEELVSVLTLENGETTEGKNVADQVFRNVRTYRISGNEPVPGAKVCSYIWYIRENGGRWKLLEGESGRDLIFTGFRRDTLTSQTYSFKRKVVTINNDSESSSQYYVTLELKTNIMQSGAYRCWADGTYARSAREYRYPKFPYVYEGVTGDGVYRIDPDGDGPIPPFDVYCDMTTDGGGWMLAGKFSNHDTKHWCTDKTYWTGTEVFGNATDTTVFEDAKGGAWTSCPVDYMMFRTIGVPDKSFITTTSLEQMTLSNFFTEALRDFPNLNSSGCYRTLNIKLVNATYTDFPWIDPIGVTGSGFRQNRISIAKCDGSDSQGVISGFDCEQDEADWGLGSLEDCVFDSNVNQVDVGSGGNGASDAYNVLLFVK